MTDRLVSSAWWMSVMSMICVGATIAIALSYCGMFELIAMRWINGVACLCVAIAISVATLQLCRLRNDLL